MVSCVYIPQKPHIILIKMENPLMAMLGNYYQTYKLHNISDGRLESSVSIEASLSYIIAFLELPSKFLSKSPVINHDIGFNQCHNFSYVQVFPYCFRWVNHPGVAITVCDHQSIWLFSSNCKPITHDIGLSHLHTVERMGQRLMFKL